MKNFMKVLAFGLMVAFVFTSCAKQPTQQMDTAKAAIEAVARPRATSMPRTSSRSSMTI